MVDFHDFHVAKYTIAPWIRHGQFSLSPKKNLSKGRMLAGGNPNVVTSQAAEVRLRLKSIYLPETQMSPLKTGNIPPKKSEKSEISSSNHLVWVAMC